jgi:hypothetical protein
VQGWQVLRWVSAKVISRSFCGSSWINNNSKFKRNRSVKTSWINNNGRFNSNWKTCAYKMRLFAINWTRRNRRINLRSQRLSKLPNSRVGNQTIRGTGQTTPRHSLQCAMPSNFSKTGRTWLVVHFLMPFQRRCRIHSPQLTIR